MTMHKALEPFGWYPDGFTREALVEGDERDFGDVTAGLLAKELIAPIEVKAAVSDRGGHEAQGTAPDKDAVGHELVGRDAKATPVDVEVKAEEDKPETVELEPEVEVETPVEVPEPETDKTKRRGRSRK